MSVNTQDILGQVRARLALARELEAGPKVGAEARYQAFRERYNAWEMWRAACLEEGAAELKAALVELFPPTPDLERHLRTTLPSLRSSDEGARTAAAQELEKLARRSLSMPLEMEVGDPRLVFPVCRLLIDNELSATMQEGESPVVEALVQYLGNVAHRMSYETSNEVYRALEAVWGTAGSELRLVVATAMCYLAAAEKWHRIAAALEQRGGKRLAALVMAMNVAGEPPMEVVPRLSAAMLARFKKSKRPQDWVVALGRCAGPEAIEVLEALRKRKVSRVTLDNINDAIADLRRRFGR